jgi:hypothetical protein
MSYPQYTRYTQHGSGFGNVFKSFMRITSPLVKKALGSDFVKRISKQALKIGSEELSDFAQDVLQGDNFKETAKKRARNVIDRIKTGKGLENIEPPCKKTNKKSPKKPLQNKGGSTCAKKKTPTKTRGGTNKKKLPQNKSKGRPKKKSGGKKQKTKKSRGKTKKSKKNIGAKSNKHTCSKKKTIFD